jgi:hypothetical protein
MKKYQYRKYKEVYKINIDIIKSLVENCDKMIIDTEQKVKLSELKNNPDKLYYINISKLNTFYLFKFFNIISFNSFGLLFFVTKIRS